MEIKLPTHYNEADYREKLGKLTYGNESNVIILFCFQNNLISIFETMAREIKHFDNVQLVVSETISDPWVLNYVRTLKNGFIYTEIMAHKIQAFEEYIANLSAGKMNNSLWFKRFYEQIMKCTFKNTSDTIIARCNSSEKIGNAFLADKLSRSQLADKTVDAVYVLAHAFHKVLENTCSGRGLQACDISGEALLDAIHNLSFISPDGRTVYMDNKGEVTGGYIFYYVNAPDRKGTFQDTNIGQWLGRLTMNSSSLSRLDKLLSVKSRCSERCTSNQVEKHIPGKPICCWTCEECSLTSIVVNKSCQECDLGFMADEKAGRCVKIQEIFYSLDNRVSMFLVVPPLVFSFLGTLGVIITMTIFIRFNDNPLIKASGRELCYILLTGLFLSFIFPIVCILRPSRSKCLAQFVLDSLPITISFVSIAVKTNRIFRIFDKNRQFNQPLLFMRPLHRVIFTFLLIFLEILMLLCLIVMHFPEGKLIYLSATEVQLACSTSATQILLSHVYNIILIIICTYYAFKTRHVPTRFKETKIIAFAMYASCFIIVTFMVMSAVAANRGADGILEPAIHSYRVVFMASIILLSFFGSKVYSLFFHKRSNSGLQGHELNLR
jgi:hypothetical protein